MATFLLHIYVYTHTYNQNKKSRSILWKRLLSCNLKKGQIVGYYVSCILFKLFKNEQNTHSDSRLSNLAVYIKYITTK